MRKSWTRLGVALVAPMLLWSSAAFGQAAKPPVHQGSTPSTVEGQVVKIDRHVGRVTIRSTDGSMHEFTASKETLNDLKEGDRIEARLRQ
jgi:Cu/Ag efflux protein CusF